MRMQLLIPAIARIRIKPSIQEGAHGEFAGFGEPGTGSEAEFDNVAQDDGGSVGGNFYDVVSGVGVGTGEVGGDNFVNALWVGRSTWVYEFAEDGVAGGGGQGGCVAATHGLCCIEI